ncbi:MAG: M48 family metalloprotease [Acidobacteria bacterium]|nr:M48 family metalloprotease [Acidobacteriota bacterium]
MKAGRVLVLLLVAAGCATNPATGKRQIMLMSEQQEIGIGRENDAAVRKQMGVYKDDELQRYVASVGMRLAQAAHRPALPWTFTVVDEPAVNAFALPGGFIYLTRGILPFLKNEAELAAVLGHEIGHVDARHSAQQYSSQTLAGGGLALLGILVPETRPAQGLASLGLQTLFLKFSREDELEADGLGVGYTARSGWDPHGMPGLLGTLARLDEATGTSRGVPNWALTHPPAADRVTKVQEAVASAPAGERAVNPAALERRLDGLVFGDSREKGIVRGNEFVHPLLQFAVRFPDGWTIQNSDEQVVAQRPEASNVAMLLELAQGSSGNLQQYAPAMMAEAGWQQLSGGRTQINGLDAYVGTYQGAVNNTRAGLRAAHVRAGNQVYVVAGLAPASQFSGAQQTFDTAIHTFRTLSRQEADRIQPNRIDFYEVRGGETWDSIARGPGDSIVKPSTLAIMNGRDPGTPPRAGERVRIVVRG